MRYSLMKWKLKEGKNTRNKRGGSQKPFVTINSECTYCRKKLRLRKNNHISGNIKNSFVALCITTLKNVI